MPRRKKGAPIALPYVVNPKTGCREYTGSRTDKNYGQITIHGKRWLVHRLKWTMENGPVPEGKDICHTCDNPPCFLEEHLFPGTRRENIRDAANKKRLGRATKARGNWKGGRPRKPRKKP